MAHKTVAEVIVETLQAAGVKHCWAAVQDWLAQPGPALLDVVTSRMELVMPPHVEPAQVFGTALYSAKALLGGRAGDVWDLVTENL